MKNNKKKRTDGQTDSRHNTLAAAARVSPPPLLHPLTLGALPDYYYTAQQNDWFMFKLTAPLSCCCCCSGRESRSFEFERGEKIAPGRTEGARGAQSYIKRVSPHHHHHHHPLNLLLLLLRWYQGLVFLRYFLFFFFFLFLLALLLVLMFVASPVVNRWLLDREWRISPCVLCVLFVRPPFPSPSSLPRVKAQLNKC